MKPSYLSFLIAASFALPAFTRANPPASPEASSLPSAAIYFDNSADVIPSDPAWSGALNEKLASFETAHGVTFFVRLHAKSPSEEEDKVPGAYMRALATKLGTAQSGVVAVYFADEDDWRLWIGDDLTAKFSGKSGSPRELTKSGAIHDAKEALFATAISRRDAEFAALQKAASVGQPVPPARRLQLHAGAVVDGVIKKLSAK